MTPLQLQEILEIQLTICSADNPEDIIRHQYRNTYSLNESGEINGLNLLGNGLTEIRNGWLEQLPELRYLNLSENKLNSFSIPGRLSKLALLNLSENESLTAVQFPETKLSKLEKIHLHDCRIVSLEVPAGLKALTWLDVARNNDLSNVEFEGDCLELVYLDLSQNKLPGFSLPTSFPKLKYLYLGGNQVEKMEFDSDLMALETLDLKNNQFWEFTPSFLDPFPNLVSLYLQGNPLPDWLMGTIEKNHYASALEFVRNSIQLLKDGADVDNEVKVIIIGNGGVGKSTLVLRLVENKFDPAYNSTHGIQIKEYPLNNYRLNLWDFGGQDIYHSTHRLFMHSKAIYLVLWDVKKEFEQPFQEILEDGETRKYDNYGLAYWLHYVRTLGKDSPSIVVQTKEGRDGKRDLPQVHERHKEHLDFLEFCSIDCEPDDPEDNGIELLQYSLKKGLKRLRPKPLAPKKYIGARNAIREIQSKEPSRKRMTIEEFRNLTPGMEENLRMQILEDWLAKTGVVFFRKDLFEGNIILDQEWAINAVYSLFDREGAYYRLKQKQGIITGLDLEKVWKSYSEGERELFLSLMISCEICFELKEDQENRYSIPFAERKYMVPKLLNEERPEGALQSLWAGRDSLYFEYRHEFLHYGVIQSFMVKTHLLADHSSMWEYGLTLREGEMLATIETIRATNQREGRNKIRIQITPNAKELLDKIRNLIEELQDDPGEEYVGVVSDDYVLLEKLASHPVDIDRIETENGNWMPKESLNIFLQKDQQAEFEFLKSERNTSTRKSMNLLQQYVAENRLKDALDLLEINVPEYKSTEVIMLKGQLNGLISDENRGIVTNEYRDIRKARIKQAILSLASNLIFPEVDLEMKPEKEEIKERTSDRMKKILFLAANPTDQARLQTDREYAEIEKRLKAGLHRDKFELLKPQLNLKVEDLIETMNQKAQIVHFSGHGMETGIVIANDQNEALIMPEGALKRLFRQHKDSVEIVILNSCYSESQAKIISEFGLYVIGMNAKIGDLAAIDFAASYYIGLCAGKDPETAFDDAMIVVETKHPAYSAIPKIWKDGEKLDL